MELLHTIDRRQKMEPDEVITLHQEWLIDNQGFHLFSDYLEDLLGSYPTLHEELTVEERLIEALRRPNH